MFLFHAPQPPPLYKLYYPSLPLGFYLSALCKPADTAFSLTSDICPKAW